MFNRFFKKHTGNNIFCINSGRAGSQYLCSLLSSAEDIAAFHEPEPEMIGDILKLTTELPFPETFQKRRIKVDAIKKTKVRTDKLHYAETNHMFIKTFFDVVCNDLKNIKVIHLRRDFFNTVKSFVELKYFSDANPASFLWMSSPNAITRAVECIDEDKKLDYIDRSIAYLIDIEGRAERFKQQFTQIPVYEIQTESLNNRDEVDRLFNWLNIKTTPNTYNLIGEKVNLRKERKVELNGEISSSFLRERIENYFKIANSKNIKFPKFIENNVVPNII